MSLVLAIGVGAAFLGAGIGIGYGIWGTYDGAIDDGQVRNDS